jgi:hypothetical protein
MDSPDKKDKSTSSIPNEAHSKATKWVEEAINDSSVLNVIEDKLQPLVVSATDEFLEENKEKAAIYASNPEVLIKDLKEFYGFKNYFKYVEYAIDAALAVSGILSIISVFFTAGAAAPAAAVGLASRKAISYATKKFMKKQGLNLLARVSSKIVLKKITKEGLKQVGVNLSKYFLRSAMYNVLYIVSINAIFKTIEDVGIEATKNILRDKGNQLGIPQSLITQLLHAENDNAFRRILKNVHAGISKDLQELFTTEAGFRKLALGAAFSKLWKTKEIAQAIERGDLENKLKQLSKDPKYRKPFDPNSPSSASQQAVKQQLERSIKKSKIPVRLQPVYQEHLSKLTTQIPPQRVGEVIEPKIELANLTTDQVVDELYEVATLEFIQKNRSRLALQQVTKLLGEALDTRNISLESLKRSTKQNDLIDIVNTLLIYKTIYIKQLLKKLSLGGQDSKMLEALKNDMMKHAGTDTYKANLSKQYFGVGRGI